MHSTTQKAKAKAHTTQTRPPHHPPPYACVSGKRSLREQTKFSPVENFLLPSNPSPHWILPLLSRGLPSGDGDTRGPEVLPPPTVHHHGGRQRRHRPEALSSTSACLGRIQAGQLGRGVFTLAAVWTLSAIPSPGPSSLLTEPSLCPGILQQVPWAANLGDSLLLTSRQSWSLIWGCFQENHMTQSWLLRLEGLLGKFSLVFKCD